MSLQGLLSVSRLNKQCINSMWKITFVLLYFSVCLPAGDRYFHANISAFFICYFRESLLPLICILFTCFYCDKSRRVFREGRERGRGRRVTGRKRRKKVRCSGLVRPIGGTLSPGAVKLRCGGKAEQHLPVSFPHSLSYHPSLSLPSPPPPLSDSVVDGL